jgi:hypothetical protein
MSQNYPRGSAVTIENVPDDLLDAGMLVDEVDESVATSSHTPRRIYAFTHAGFAETPWTRETAAGTKTGKGLIKVGTTTRTTDVRVREILITSFPNLDGVEILHDEAAIRTDGTYFGDVPVHRALMDSGVRKVGGEWFEADLEDLSAAIVAVRHGRSLVPGRAQDFPMRPEQERAVALTANYLTTNSKGQTGRSARFLWNAKMRFGKTFTTYQLAREMGWKRILVLTFKPAVHSQWRDDLRTHVAFDGWNFVDRATTAETMAAHLASDEPLVWFASFQDIMGRTDDGSVKEHNRALGPIDWDCIVLDEYHFGAWRETSRDLYDPAESALAAVEEPSEGVTEADLGLTSDNYLYLSGTPFRAMTNGEFPNDAVYSWTYTDEQSAKAAYDGPDPSPYADLPALEMFAYQISEETARVAMDVGADAFGLSDYFKATKVRPHARTDSPGAYEFENPTQVSEFIDMLRGKLEGHMRSLLRGGQHMRWPYEDAHLKKAAKHSVWYLPDVASCYAMRDMLADHHVFSEYEIVVVAGSNTPNGAAAKPIVTDAIARSNRERRAGTITITCGKLMTGVTIKEWGAIFMLLSLQAPESYFQAAFRIQSPWSSRETGDRLVIHKPTAYIFEFDPNRALGLVAEYALRMAASSALENAEGPSRSEVFGDLLRYLPIFRLEGGRMARLDADEVLDIATIGVGAKALARRWNDAALVSVNEFTLQALLDNPDLMTALSTTEDFTNLPESAVKIITATDTIKNAQREKRELEPGERKEVDDAAKLRKKIRVALQKFCAKVPVFMYVTDFREESLVDIIESLDADLFTKVTGLSAEDFQLLNRLGVFNAEHLDSAIYQFKRLEEKSLHYADEHPTDSSQQSIGLWNRTARADVGEAP